VPFIPPLDYERVTYWIAGPPKAGKSTMLASLVKCYHENWPDRDIWLIMDGDKAMDPALAKLKCKQLDIKGTDIVTGILTDGQDGKHYDIREKFVSKGKDGAAIIMDDIDAYGEPYQKACWRLAIKIVMVARKANVSLFVTSHELTAGLKTSAVIKNCENVVTFPDHTLHGDYEYFMNRRLGVSVDQVRRLKPDSGSSELGRWNILKTQAPQAVLAARNAFFL
jgi:hypothetical protein